MNGFIGIKTNWYTKVTKTLTCVQAIRLHHIQN